MSKISAKEKKQKQNKKLVECEEKLAEYLAGWQRAQADYQNLKKESTLEKERLAGFIRADVLSQIFPIIDHFEIALRHVPAEQKKEKWFVGFEHLHNQIQKVLDEFGVVKMQTEGLEFDVESMEAVGREKKSGIDSGRVISEISAGYKMDNQVIKPAKVIVAE